MISILKIYRFNTIKVCICFIIVFIYIYISIIIFNKNIKKIDYEKDENICMKEKFDIHKNLEDEMIKQQERILLGLTSKTIFRNSVISLLQKIDSCHRTNDVVKMPLLKSYQMEFFIFFLLSFPIFVLMILEIYKRVNKHISLFNF
ncbi:Hypothetical protein SRAE_2000383800 [Strongyloides ratti]|uniref:Fam-l protein n=1 Tax=Strongyloides ratti TaxID=34506 RepID=A0A090LM26_STRRB|nr:Hypothetical protein SRAE_2000383800 [Strongyloides ratti]CEF69188.1 Hypothetical protein SRAE_2000383800 [Strongyloides ratti]